MIALDANVLVRCLVDDDAEQAASARALLAGLTAERRGFVCREATVELVWVLRRAYGFSRRRIAEALESLAASMELEIEASADVVRAARRYRRGDAGFADLMIVAAAERSGAHTLYTFDRELAKLAGAAAPGGPPH